VTAASQPPRPHERRVDLRTWIGDVARAQQKPLGVATTVFALLVIARLTLAPMGGVPSLHFDTCLPCGDAGWADFLLNVGLFVPLGIGLRLAGLKQRTAAVIAIALTIAIETLQFYVIPGRESDSSDIVANSIGAILGIAAVGWRRHLVTPGARAARRLSVCAAAAICVIAAAAQWALVLDFPRTTYFPQVAPDLPGFAPFHGDVLAASFDGTPIRIGRLSADASGRMRDALAAGTTVIAITVRPLPRQRRIAPITDVHDQYRSEIFFLARRGHDLLFRVRRRTEPLGFHTPSIALTEAFPVQLAAGDTVAARVTVGTGAITLDAAIGSGAGQRTMHRRIGHGVWDLWRLLIPDTGPLAERQRALTALMLCFLFGPLGYWLGRATRADASARARPSIWLSALAIVALPLGASLAIIPWVAHAPIAPGLAWGASVVALVVASGIGRWSAAEPDRQLVDEGHVGSL